MVWAAAQAFDALFQPKGNGKASPSCLNLDVRKKTVRVRKRDGPYTAIEERQVLDSPAFAGRDAAQAWHRLLSPEDCAGSLIQRRVLEREDNGGICQALISPVRRMTPPLYRYPARMRGEQKRNRRGFPARKDPQKAAKKPGQKMLRILIFLRRVPFFPWTIYPPRRNPYAFFL